MKSANILLFSMCVLFPGTVCLADIHINLSSPSASILESDGLTRAPATWLVQLIYAGEDDVTSPYDPANPLIPRDDDRVLRTQRLNVLGGEAGIAGRIEGGELLVFTDARMVGHRVYTRVFNVNYVGLPDAGTPSGTPTLFGQSALSAVMQVATVSPSSILKYSPVIMIDHSTAPPQSVGIDLSVTAAGDASGVSCPLVTGFYYYLETSQDLRAGSWTTLTGPIKGTGPNTIPIPEGLPAPSYLRVRTE